VGVLIGIGFAWMLWLKGGPSENKRNYWLTMLTIGSAMGCVQILEDARKNSGTVDLSDFLFAPMLAVVYAVPMHFVGCARYYYKHRGQGPETVWQPSGPITPEDIKRLQAQAKARREAAR
jgi:hypothetical protein